MIDPRVQAVIDAWTVEGPQPVLHRAEQRRLRRVWPTLGRALDALCEPDDLGEIEPGLYEDDDGTIVEVGSVTEAEDSDG